MITIEEEQRLFPDITFTCNGLITKWIVGAGDIDIGEQQNTQVQIWRRGAGIEYSRVGATPLVLVGTSYPNVYEYLLNPPLEFQEGDILGMYQPHKTDNLLKLYYQKYTGPLNYARSNIKSPPSWAVLDSNSLATQVYYPLVSAVVVSTVRQLVATSTTSSAAISTTSAGKYLLYFDCSYLV